MQRRRVFTWPVRFLLSLVLAVAFAVPMSFMLLEAAKRPATLNSDVVQAVAASFEENYDGSWAAEDPRNMANWVRDEAVGAGFQVTVAGDDKVKLSMVQNDVCGEAIVGEKVIWLSGTYPCTSLPDPADRPLVFGAEISGLQTEPVSSTVLGALTVFGFIGCVMFAWNRADSTGPDRFRVPRVVLVAHQAAEAPAAVPQPVAVADEPPAVSVEDDIPAWAVAEPQSSLAAAVGQQRQRDDRRLFFVVAVAAVVVFALGRRRR